jgi:hypothetical protein
MAAGTLRLHDSLQRYQIVLDTSGPKANIYDGLTFYTGGWPVTPIT